MNLYLSLNHVEEETSKTGQYNINKHVSINILITLIAYIHFIFSIYKYINKFPHLYIKSLY